MFSVGYRLHEWERLAQIMRHTLIMEDVLDGTLNRAPALPAAAPAVPASREYIVPAITGIDMTVSGMQMAGSTSNWGLSPVRDGTLGTGYGTTRDGDARMESTISNHSAVARSVLSIRSVHGVSRSN